MISQGYKKKATFCCNTDRGIIMGIEREIEKAAKRIVALDTKNKKTADEEAGIISTVKSSLESGAVDFGNMLSLTLKQKKKKRFVKRYQDLYSAENILCQCIKQILDRAFKVRYPNRNKVSKELFNVLGATIQMSDFTIIKFDFKNYFNSISSEYVFEKYLKENLLDRAEIDLIRKFAHQTKYAYAGLCTSNAIAEIIAKYFDKFIRQEFMKNGIIYYERYIDDGILILNEYIEENEVKEILQSALSNVFFDDTIKTTTKCTTKLNQKKFQYISRRNISNAPCSVDFLGYEFWFSKNASKIELKYGISKEKQEKYNGRIDRLISLYKDPASPDYQDLELLRHRIAAFSSREVYLTKHFHSNVWKVKGFISNYRELRYLLGTGLVEDNTELYLKSMINDAFDRAGIPKPYFLPKNAQIECGYNLYDNMMSNKTLLLVDHIGYDYKSLVALCRKIGIKHIDASGKRRGYGTLVRDYLIKVKVGY